MKKSIIILATVLTVCSCGTQRKQSAADGWKNESVNVGYGSMTKDDMNTSVSKVRVKDKETVTYSDMYAYLRGRVPGVVVGPSNDGSTPRIIIRGIGTNSGQTDPLILVDNVPVADLWGVDPNNVASVEVLKDSSASIYGAQSMNGVILITTKR